MPGRISGRTVSVPDHGEPLTDYRTPIQPVLNAWFEARSTGLLKKYSQTWQSELIRVFDKAKKHVLRLFQKVQNLRKDGIQLNDILQKLNLDTEHMKTLTNEVWGRTEPQNTHLRPGTPENTQRNLEFRHRVILRQKLRSEGNLRRNQILYATHTENSQTLLVSAQRKDKSPHNVEPLPRDFLLTYRETMENLRKAIEIGTPESADTFLSKDHPGLPLKYLERIRLDYPRKERPAVLKKLYRELENRLFDLLIQHVPQSYQNLPPGKPHILAFRYHREDDPLQQYDDLMIVLWKTKEGTKTGTEIEKHVRIFHTATHSDKKTHPQSTDVDKDGKGDVARLRPGTYAFVMSGPGGKYQYRHLRATRPLPVWRDINHDGRVSPEERKMSEEKNYHASGILIHIGGRERGHIFDQTYDVNGVKYHDFVLMTRTVGNIGCQTLPPREYRKFMSIFESLKIQNDARIMYTLVEAKYQRINELIAVTVSEGNKK